MFEDLEYYRDIAARKNFSEEYVRRLAMDKKRWPPVERQIGPVKFFAKICVDQFFEQKVDRRINVNKKRRGR